MSTGRADREDVCGFLLLAPGIDGVKVRDQPGGYVSAPSMNPGNDRARHPLKVGALLAERDMGDPPGTELPAPGHMGRG